MAKEVPTHYSLNTLCSVSETIRKKVLAEKKIKVDENDVRQIVDDLCNYIELINSLEKEATIINGYPLSEIEIIEELSSLVQPASIRMDVSTYLTSELLVETVPLMQETEFKKSTWEELQSRFRNIFKKDSVSNRLSISDLRKQFNLMDVIDKVACPVIDPITNEVTYRTRYIGEAFVPYLVNIDLSAFYTRSYWTAPLSEIFDDFWAKRRFN